MVDVQAPRGAGYAAFATALLFLAWAGLPHAQQPDSTDIVRAAVLDAVTAALPFPAAGDDRTPLDGSPVPRWLRFPAAPDDDPSRLVTVVANPLNQEVQAQALRDMRDIQRSVDAAEARARGEFADRTSAAAQTERERPMLGISLDDEGVAGARADWRAQLTIDYFTYRAADASVIDGQTMPQVESSPRPAVRLAEREYDAPAEQGTVRRFAPEELRLYLGLAALPIVTAASDSHLIRLELPAGKTVVEIRARGNPALVQQLADRANWAKVEALLR